jgi:hypothetical protein
MYPRPINSESGGDTHVFRALSLISSIANIFSAVLEIELGALHIIDKPSTIEQHSQNSCSHIFEVP